MIRDLRVHGHNNKSFDDFLAVTEINELQAAAVNDRRLTPGTDISHEDDILINMALSISAQDMCDRCLSEKKMQKERIPSQLWFKFQFWPKNPYAHSLMNFTGMVQQRTKRDDHYCSVLFKYSREIAI